jgi:hypothetical protein
MFHVSTQCKCGAGIAVSILTLSLLYSFMELHQHCITENSNEEIEEPGGDVFAQAQLARDHSEPELQTGFQRQWL